MTTGIGNMHDHPQPPSGPKPEWWTEAWDSLEGVVMSPLGAIQPISPKQFKEEVYSDVYAFDQPGLLDRATS
jgi:hypothetical protein